MKRIKRARFFVATSARRARGAGPDYGTRLASVVTLNMAYHIIVALFDRPPKIRAQHLRNRWSGEVLDSLSWRSTIRRRRLGHLLDWSRLPRTFGLHVFEIVPCSHHVLTLYYSMRLQLLLYMVRDAPFV